MTQRPFSPFFNTMPILDMAIQIGRGVDASVEGQTYSVYRLSDTVSGSIVTGQPVLSRYPARVRRATSKISVENAFFEALAYEVNCDNRCLVLQDVLVQTGYENDNSVFTFAQARPTRETIFMRTESAITITRPNPPAGQAVQQPNAGSVFQTGYGGVTKDTELILTLVDGLYSFDGMESPPATIYCGLQPSAKISETPKGTPAGQMPTALYRERFAVYVPDLPGIVLNELDRLNFPNNDRYEIMLYHSTNETGLTGYICIVEKLSV